MSCVAKETVAINLLVLSFLNRYKDNTQDLYRRYVKQYERWCSDNELQPWTISRIDLERYVKHLQASGYKPGTIHSAMTPLRMIFKLAHADGLIPKNPSVLIWMPRVIRDPAQFPWYNRMELSHWVKTASTISPRHHAVGVLMGVLALRVSEVAHLEVGDWKFEQNGHRVLKFVGKGNKLATMPLDVPLLRAMMDVSGDRENGPLIPSRNGTYLTRGGMTGLVYTISRRAGLKQLSPHGIRRSCITAALDMNIPIRDVQALARHTELKTTMLYDRNGQSLDRHAAHSMASWLT